MEDSIEMTIDLNVIYKFNTLNTIRTFSEPQPLNLNLYRKPQAHQWLSPDNVQNVKKETLLLRVTRHTAKYIYESWLVPSENRKIHRKGKEQTLRHGLIHTQEQYKVGIKNR